MTLKYADPQPHCSQSIYHDSTDTHPTDNIAFDSGAVATQSTSPEPTYLSPKNSKQRISKVDIRFVTMYECLPVYGHKGVSSQQHNSRSLVVWGSTSSLFLEKFTVQISTLP